MAQLSKATNVGGGMNRTETRMSLYDDVSIACSRLTTNAYSTSFSLSIKTLASDLRDHIYAIYGFVRLADEIVDSFHGHQQAVLLGRLEEETYQALDERISTNPILQAFQRTYHQFGLERDHVDQFLQSMEWDLDRKAYDRANFDSYVVGSAEVVGLMCLKVFVRGDDEKYQELKGLAVRLGAAFQKVNFLRDLQEDYHELGRSYFPDLDMQKFDDETKREIEKEIEQDFDLALEGIRKLPRDVRFGVFLAYTYYRHLLNRILKMPSSLVMRTRVRVSAPRKTMLTIFTYAKHRLNLV